ncbi:hypothetical protein [Streptomyces sp. NPDC004014]
MSVSSRGTKKLRTPRVIAVTGTPRVELSNSTKDGTGDEDIAWGAVAFQPLAGKPADSVVAMGDSYSPGEAVTGPNGSDLYPETDHPDKRNDAEVDECHRSRLAWSRQATLPGHSSSIGALADSLDPSMDYHFVACSGARTYNVLDQGLSGELPQLETGYLTRRSSSWATRAWWRGTTAASPAPTRPWRTTGCGASPTAWPPR